MSEEVYNKNEQRNLSRTLQQGKIRWFHFSLLVLACSVPEWLVSLLRTLLMLNYKQAERLMQLHLEAARLAADAAKFRPYSITSGFGQSFFDTEKNTAGYNIDPRLAASRDTLYGQAEQTMGAIGTPEEQARQYYQQTNGLACSSAHTGRHGCT